MTRAVVTGGAGFLGSHLCRRLLGEGWDVVSLDSLLTGAEANVSDLFEHPRFEFQRRDITKGIEVSGDVDWVLHLASPASPVDYTEHPIHTMKVGAIGTMNALGLAKARGAHFMLTSTSEVYGDPEVHPQPETYRGNVSTTGPRAIYDESKRFGETLVAAYHRAYGVDARIVRIFNTYGERMDPEDGRVVVNFVTQALRGQPLTIYGDGRQTRSFCYVADLVRGLVAVMEAEGMAGEVFNLGNPDERTIADFAATIQRACGVDLPVEHRPLPTDDPTRRCPDIAKARRLLGWSPEVGLEEGLRRTVPYFRAELTNAQPVPVDD